MKKAMLLAATACVALFALPAVASAGTWHVQNGTIGFSGTGGVFAFTTASGSATQCTSKTTAGAYETTTTGWVKYTFHGCTGPFGVHCTTTGQPTGTITTTKLTFHNVRGPSGEISTLVTPNHDGHFWSANCFGIVTKVTGNGLMDTLNKSCGEKSSSATVTFSSTAPGVPSPTQITGAGTQYTLESSTGGGAPVMMSLDSSESFVFAGGAEQTFECT